MGLTFSATFVAFALQYVFGVISPKTKIRNVMIPTAIANPSLPKIRSEMLVAKADAPTFTMLFPRLIDDIIQPGFDFSLCNAWEPLTPFFINCEIFDCLVPTSATSEPLKNPDKPMRTAKITISSHNSKIYPPKTLNGLQLGAHFVFNSTAFLIVIS